MAPFSNTLCYHTHSHTHSFILFSKHLSIYLNYELSTRSYYAIHPFILRYQPVHTTLSTRSYYAIHPPTQPVSHLSVYVSGHSSIYSSIPMTIHSYPFFDSFMNLSMCFQIVILFGIFNKSLLFPLYEIFKRKFFLKGNHLYSHPIMHVLVE